MQGCKLPLKVLPFEDLVPENHLLRRVNEVLDFSFIYELTKPYYCLNNGRNSIDPVLYFRIQLIAYFFNISSERKVCHELKFNLAYRWFCGLNISDKIPHHSSLSRIRSRFGVTIIKEIFEYIINYCVSNKYIKVDSVITDSTLIRANASLDSLQQKNKTSLSGFKRKKKLSNDTHISKTDPDATLARKSGTEQSLKYKIHTTIDSESRVIIDCHATTGSQHDSKTYLERIKYIRKNFNLNLISTIADRAYGSGEIIDELNKKGIIPFIPLFNRECGKKKENNDFKYDSEKDCYICPTGKFLKPSINKKTRLKLYISLLKDCSNCSLNNECVDKKTKRKRICRSLYQEVYEKHFKIINSIEFSQKLKERFWKIEGINAEAKNLHSLKRAHYRGRQKVQIQVYLVALIQNIKRLITIKNI